MLKKTKKRASVIKTVQAWSNKITAVGCAGYPLHKYVVPTNTFELGIGEIFIVRRIPDGTLAVSAFIVDVFLLGRKKCIFLSHG